MVYWHILQHKSWVHFSKWKKPVKKDHIWLYLYDMYRIGKSIETENRLVLSKGQRIQGISRVALKMYMVCFGHDENGIIDHDNSCRVLWI